MYERWIRRSQLPAGLGARLAFLSDAERRYLDELGLRETTDTVHDPYRPAAFTLYPARGRHTCPPHIGQRLGGRGTLIPYAHAEQTN